MNTATSTSSATTTLADEVLDSRDVSCPLPIIQTAQAIAGLSSGAYGAANIGARNPGLFGTAMSFSGYFVGTSPALGADPAVIRANSPFYLVQDQPRARTVVYILSVGNHDPTYQRRTQAFADLLTALGVSHQLNVVAGGHGGTVWAQGLAVGMAQVATALSHPSGVISEDHDRRRL